ncbi:MAG: methylcrotonoyl-CoA carboxylase, partial [Candidatus Eremiobacteraeota bacterium]|nr:methylcrotonoyl-CoA carboxylase [Candidatus Eremiobacteraeota bacterium]
MAVLDSRIDRGSADYAANREYFIELIGELRRKTALAAQGGGADAMAKHAARGKLPVRERIARLLDAQTPFLEFSPLAADGMYRGDAPSAGIVTGIGIVEGHQCVIVANDATVKGGTYYP